MTHNGLRLVAKNSGGIDMLNALDMLGSFFDDHVPW